MKCSFFYKLPFLLVAVFNFKAAAIPTIVTGDKAPLCELRLHNPYPVLARLVDEASYRKRFRYPYLTQHLRAHPQDPVSAFRKEVETLRDQALAGVSVARQSLLVGRLANEFASVFSDLQRLHPELGKEEPQTINDQIVYPIIWAVPNTRRFTSNMGGSLTKVLDAWRTYPLISDDRLAPSIHGVVANELAETQAFEEKIRAYEDEVRVLSAQIRNDGAEWHRRLAQALPLNSKTVANVEESIDPNADQVEVSVWLSGFWFQDGFSGGGKKNYKYTVIGESGKAEEIKASDLIAGRYVLGFGGGRIVQADHLGIKILTNRGEVTALRPAFENGEPRFGTLVTKLQLSRPNLYNPFLDYSKASKIFLRRWERVANVWQSSSWIEAISLASGEKINSEIKLRTKRGAEWAIPIICDENNWLEVVPR